MKRVLLELLQFCQFMCHIMCKSLGIISDALRVYNPYLYKDISLISSFSNFLTSSYLVRFFRLTAPAAVLGHLGAISLKNLTKRKEVRKSEKELIRLIILQDCFCWMYLVKKEHEIHSLVLMMKVYIFSTQMYYSFWNWRRLPISIPTILYTHPTRTNKQLCK